MKNQNFNNANTSTNRKTFSTLEPSLYLYNETCESENSVSARSQTSTMTNSTNVPNQTYIRFGLIDTEIDKIQSELESITQDNERLFNFLDSIEKLNKKMLFMNLLTPLAFLLVFYLAIRDYILELPDLFNNIIVGIFVILIGVDFIKMIISIPNENKMILQRVEIIERKLEERK